MFFTYKYFLRNKVAVAGKVTNSSRCWLSWLNCLWYARFKFPTVHTSKSNLSWMHEQIIAFQIRSTSDLWRTWSLINNNCHAFVHSSVLLTKSLIILIFSNRCQSSLKRNANDFCSFEPLKYCSFTRLSRRSFRWFWKMCSFKDI